LVGAAGCFRPDTDAAAPPEGDALAPPTHLFRREAGSGDAGADAAVPIACAAPSALRALKFIVSTSPVGGRFAPRNVGAIWIETGAGTFVRTLEVWGNMRAKWLSAWLASGAGDTVDAVTGATLAEHLTHTVTWNLRDAHGCEAPAGQYALRIELTDRSGAGATLAIPFAKEFVGFVLMPPDTATFQGMRVTLE
jgi:hypothetical protein